MAFNQVENFIKKQNFLFVQNDISLNVNDNRKFRKQIGRKRKKYLEMGMYTLTCTVVSGAVTNEMDYHTQNCQQEEKYQYCNYQYSL